MDDSSSTNFGPASCEVLRGTRIRMVVAITDSVNSGSDKMYSVKFTSVPGPYYPVNTIWPVL
jgi:hypothetical protein